MCLQESTRLGTLWEWVTTVTITRKCLIFYLGSLSVVKQGASAGGLHDSSYSGLGYIPCNHPIRHIVLIVLNCSSCWHIQLSTSSLAIHRGAIFSAVSGRKSIPISAIEAPEHGAWYRVHGFYLTTTFCLNPAQQAVSLWNCRVCFWICLFFSVWICYSWQILVVFKAGNPSTNTAISIGNGLLCWI